MNWSHATGALHHTDFGPTDGLGYRDVWSLLEHYPRASFAVLDRAGHNLQIEQPRLFTAITAEWLDRVEESFAFTVRRS